MAPRMLVVCPTRFEWRWLRHHLGAHTDIECCGPGPEAVRRWCGQRLASSGDGRLVVLAGLAGGLSERARPGEAYAIADVHDERGLVLASVPSAGTRSFAVVSVPAPVTAPAATRTLAATSRADLVDLESAGFAAAVWRARRQWAIVRGVSDGPDQHLPRTIGGWVDGMGRMRALTIATAVLRRPRDMRDLARLRRQSLEAMRSAAEVLARLPA